MQLSCTIMFECLYEYFMQTRLNVFTGYGGNKFIKHPNEIFAEN